MHASAVCPQVSLLTNIMHCGYCGHSCVMVDDTEVCKVGICEYDVTYGQVSTVAGDGDTLNPTSSENVPARNSPLPMPLRVAAHNDALYVVANGANCVQRIDLVTSVVTTVAGVCNITANGTDVVIQEGLGATIVPSIFGPVAVAVDKNGSSLYITDENRISKVDLATGLLTTVHDNTNNYTACALALGPDNHLYWADCNSTAGKLDLANPANWTVIAGNATGIDADGILATEAHLSAPYGIAIDAFGNVFIADVLDHKVRLVNATGYISTIAGTGADGYDANEHTAKCAQLNGPNDVAVDDAGTLYIADTKNQLVRRVPQAAELGPSASIYDLAGKPSDPGYVDGTQMTQLSLPYGLCFSPWRGGSVFVADVGNNRVRKIAVVHADG